MDDAQADVDENREQQRGATLGKNKKTLILHPGVDLELLYRQPQAELKPDPQKAIPAAESLHSDDRAGQSPTSH